MLPRLVFRRAYHAAQHANPELVNNLSGKILSTALEKYVPTFGFKEVSILNAAKDLNYQSSSILSAFETDAVSALVNYNLSSKRLALSSQVEEAFDEDKALMMKNLMIKRLEANRPIIQHYSEALSRMILPQNISTSLEELLKLADEFQYLCDDRSNDFSWYSKRLSVAMVYVQSELHMLKSDDFGKTISFMNRQLDEVNRLGNAYNDVEEWSVFQLMSLVNLIKSQLARG